MKRRSFALLERIGFFAVLFLIEWGSLTHLVHKGQGAGQLFQLAVVFFSFWLAFGYARAQSLFRRISGELETTPIGWGFLAGHGIALLGFVGLSLFAPIVSSSTFASAITVLWFITGAAAIALAGLAVIPPGTALRLVRATGYAWAAALPVAIVTCKLISFFSLWNGPSWKPVTDLTFGTVHVLLRLILPSVIADRGTMTIGSSVFQVAILPWCSGYEGTALMLIFISAWLVFCRRELRFPQAFVLIPAAMLAIWFANAVRITALILIGVAGAPAIALGGFHSQAGWIGFNCVALGFVVAARRLPWVSLAPQRSLRNSSSQNPTAVYLMPFLMILAAAIVSRAASGGLEWLYPLRFVAAAAALWYFRREYKELDWRFGWLAPAIGCLVFAMWILLDRFSGTHDAGGIAAGLAALPASARMAWLVVRVAAAVTTVPIAEELAFRGFLNRRLISADFTSVGFREFTAVSVLLSSLAFGLLHGERWVAGAVAGLLYAAVLLRRGRIGDAVVAHATTNALLAIWVLAFGAWSLW